jgi:hypothetical protein
MTIRYCGVGGSDANDGLTWGTRKLSLNGVEDSPVAAGDTVYVGPGSYEVNGTVLTCDVSGTNGNPITYVGDVTGEHTDGVGGVVRLASTTNNTSGAAADTVTVGTCSYRTFRGLSFGGAGTSNYCVSFATGATALTCEDCTFAEAGNGVGLGSNLAADPVLILRRCVFVNIGTICVALIAASSLETTCLIENTLFIGSKYNATQGVSLVLVSGVTVKNCIFDGLYYGIRLGGNPSSGVNTVTNSVFTGGRYGVWAVAGGATYLTESHNVFGNTVATPRTIVTTGTNSVTQWVNFELPLLYDGQIIGAWNPWRPSQWSDHRRKAGTGEATDDLFGIDRPTTSAKKSWGAIQYQEPIRSTTQTYGSSAASLKLEDAGEVQFVVPVTAVSTTISVRAYREANYAGTAPQMVIKQPGQSDRTVTDAGSAGAWNELTDTFTPASLPGWVTVCLRSNNSATSGSYGVYFDSLAVS